VPTGLSWPVPQHRSTSPNTMSSEPRMADTSTPAVAYWRQMKSMACKCAKPGARILQRYGLLVPSEHQIDAELALGRFDGGVHSPFGGHLETFGVELEVMDQRFHRPLHLAALGRHDLAVGGRHRPLFLAFSSCDALLHDLHRLPHLFHADQIAVIAVAVLADRNVEVELGIALIGLRRRRSQAAPEPRTITPEKPQAQHRRA
jgi:hypothetical protein